MATGKIKFVAILAGLIVAGGLLSAASKAASEHNSKPVLPASGQMQSADSNSQPSYNEFGIAGRWEFFYKMLLSILVVIGLGIAVVYVSKKIMPRITNLPGKQIRIVETTHLGPRKGIHLVQVGTRRLLIASTDETITMLAEVTDSGPNFAAELEKRS
jgi:flagellar biosynthetic protein FliO